MKEYFVGIDPGKKGGIYFLPKEKDFHYLFSFKEDLYKNIDLYSLYTYIQDNLPDLDNLILYPVIEHVWSFPGQGVASMFKFGYCTGQLEALMVCLSGKSVKKVAPQTWQKAMFGVVEDTKIAALEYTKKEFSTYDFFKTGSFNETFGKPLKSGKKSSKVLHDGLIDAYCIAKYAKLNYHKM